MALLQIFVENRCSSCRRAVALADQAARRYPALRMEVINLSETRTEPPHEVFAVPTFRLDGQVLSLGNPRPAELMRRLAARLAGREGCAP